MPDNPNLQKIPITDPQHLIDLGITRGLLMALAALKEIEHADRLTGVGVSRHAIQSVESEHRVSVMQRNIRLALKHDVDLDKHHILWEGRAEILVEPMDLVEQANVR